LPSWGYSYGYTYSNPYYVVQDTVTTPVYDYSQPIVINTYNTSASDSSTDQTVTQTTEDSPETQAGYELFDQAHDAFRSGDYDRALKLDEAAIQKVPQDPVLHEFGALCLFALGDYTRTAAVLNALLAVAPGMDWTTMSSLYPDVDVYTQQLRNLEAYSKQNPDDPAAHFVLAYHYLVTGHADSAVPHLQAVVAKQPEDQVAKRMLDALTAPEEEPEPEQLPPPAAGVPDGAADATDAAEPTEEPEQYTDLVGKWAADRNEDRFGLEIKEDGAFTWVAIPEGQDRVSISGQAATTSDTLILESGDQGTMVGQVASGGPDKFQFVFAGSPPGDEGLTFQRIAARQ
jgi:hypothetical protein